MMSASSGCELPAHVRNRTAAAPVGSRITPRVRREDVHVDRIDDAALYDKGGPANRS